MLLCMNYTKDYEHDYFFEFKGEKYRVNSVVRLTDEARLYLGAWRKEVILKEQYTDRQDRLCWKYEFKSISYTVGIINKDTDRTPDELIEEIVEPASEEYASREILGVNSPVYNTGVKQTKSDWEIPEVRRALIIFIIVFIAASIFKDWYVQWIIRIFAAWMFGTYRKAYIDAYTTYKHPEDDKILEAKYFALYGIQPNKEENDNEQKTQK